MKQDCPGTNPLKQIVGNSDLVFSFSAIIEIFYAGIADYDIQHGWDNEQGAGMRSSAEQWIEGWFGGSWVADCYNGAS